MTLRKAASIASLVSAGIVAIARAVVALGYDSGAMFLAPGIFVDIFRTRSVHGGFNGWASELVVDGVSVITWFFVVTVALGILDMLVGYVRSKKKA